MGKKPTERTTGRFFTVPNLLSFFRLATAPLVFLFFSLPPPEGRWITLGFLALSFSTDFFDGFFARRLKQQSDLGRILDPLADKVVVLALMIAVVLFRPGPLSLLPFLLVVLGRDMLILAGGYYVRRTRGVVLESNIWGKAATFILMAAFLAFIFDDLWWPAFIVFLAGFALVLVSFVTYIVLFVKTMQPGSPPGRTGTDPAGPKGT